MAGRRRALHFVFKVGDRRKTMNFFRSVLGMKILRHEEFEEGCKAACNGPYDGKWSKSMVGYGPEDSHFVCELTYNYGVGSYALGNDFQGLTIKSKSVAKAIEGETSPVTRIEAPGGYPFHIRDEDIPGDPIVKCSLSCSDLQRSYDYWVGLLEMKCYDRSESSLLLGYADNQAKLELIKIEGQVDHAKAFGRIAFACERNELLTLQKLMTEKGQTILTPLVSLDTPDKAAVEVVILADPDGHEICFVGDEAFRDLSQVDPKAEELLDQALDADKSDEWYAKKGRSKDSA